MRLHRLDEASAPELASVVRFLRDAGGSESLGIGYAALFLRAAPAGADTTEIFAAIGTMADRLARRASGRKTTSRDAALAGHLEVAASYGVRFESVDGDPATGAARLCYDGEAWARVLATPGAPPVEKARAALFLAGTRCQPAILPPAKQRAFNDRRLQALGDVDPAALTAWLGGRVRLARAEALAWRAFDEARTRQRRRATARRRKDEAAAVKELALTDRGVLAPEDLARYDETAMRVAAGRWASEPAPRDDAQARRRDHDGAARARRDVRARRRRLGRAGERQRQAARRALHLRRRLVERAALGALGHHRDARRPAAAGVDRAVGRAQGAPTRGRSRRSRPRRPSPTSATSRAPASPPTARACSSCARPASPAARRASSRS